MYNSTGRVFQMYNSTGRVFQMYNSTVCLFQMYNSTGRVFQMYNSTGRVFQMYNSTGCVFQMYNSTGCVFQMYNSTVWQSMSLGARDWAMLAAHNVSMEDLLLSSGLGTSRRWFDPRTELFVVLAFAGIVLLGLVGNALLAATLLRRGNFRSPRHWYILNLVLSDILTCVLCVPFVLLRLTLKDWPLGQVLCRVGPFLQLTYVFVSVFTILAIAVDRYRAIVCATRLQPHRHRLARLVIPSIWLLSLVLASPIAITHRLERVHNLTGGEQVLLTLCVEYWESEQLLGAYTVLLLLFQYALPAAAIMALHLLICRFLRTRVHLRADSKVSRQKLARHRKNLVLLSVISITFDVEWLPITVVNIIADFDPEIFPSASRFCLIYALCLLFALTSVFVNPIVYGWFNSSVRRDLCGSWGRRFTSERSGSTLGRDSSDPASRFNTTTVGSSGASRLHGSLEGVLNVSSACLHQAKVPKHHGSFDGSRSICLSRSSTELKGQRLSLQLDFK